MVTYIVVKGASGFGYHVVVKESGVVVAGPFTSEAHAQAERDRRHVDTYGIGLPRIDRSLLVESSRHEQHVWHEAGIPFGGAIGSLPSRPAA